MAREVDTHNQGVTYMRITAGKIRQTANEGDNGAKSRTVINKQTNESSIKWEFVYKSMSGIIKNIETVKSDKINLTSLCITLYDEIGDDTVILQCPEKSDYALTFLEKIPNVDISKPVKIAPYQFEDQDTKKIKTGVTIYQEINPGLGFTDENQSKINKFWTKDNPGDMPMFDPDNIEMWLLQRRMFLYKYFTDNISKNINKKDIGVPHSNPSNQKVEAGPSDETDDLPF